MFSVWKFLTNSGTYSKRLPSGTWARHLAPWLSSFHHYLCSKMSHPRWNNYICRPPRFKSYRTPPSTIPPSILVTPLKPDLVLLHRVANLTCSTNTKSNLAAAHSRKQNKKAYGILVSDMANQGWAVDYETLEIGSLGHYQREMPSFIICIGPSQTASKGPPRPLCQSCHLILLPHLSGKELPQLITPFLVVILNPVL